jgi:acetyltransferase-like isoleucine patch superfamily enzyme
MKVKLLSRLVSFRMVKAAWAFACYIKSDFQSGRFRGVLLIGLGNLLPDLFGFAVVRAVLWRLAGVQLADYSSTVIRAGAFTEYPRNLTAGKNFQINRNTYLGTNDRIVIGDHVTISINCNVLTVYHDGTNHEIDVLAPVIIKSHCLIYANCTILPGAVLEEGVVLAAGSLLKGRTEPWCIYAGVPARRIKARERGRPEAGS